MEGSLKMYHLGDMEMGRAMIDVRMREHSEKLL